MLTKLLTRGSTRGQKGAEAGGDRAEGACRYAVHAAMLDGKDVRVFVAPHGTAAAVELGSDRASVLTGLAAGIVLSDVEEAGAGPAQGLGARTAMTHALSAPRTVDVIEDMAVLTDGQKDQLRAALCL